MSLTPLPSSTLACGGAPAVVKPGIPPTATLAGTAITAILTAFGAELAAVIFDALLAGVNWDIENICTTGDPGDPGLTLTDYANALNAQDVALSVPAIAKFHQWVAHAMFPQWCNCADGTSPGAPTVSVPPPYVPNPGAPSGGTTSPCWDVTQVFNTDAPEDLSRLFLPWNGIVTVSPPPYGNTEAPTIPQVLNTTVYWRATFNASVAPTDGPYALLQSYQPNLSWGNSPYMWDFRGLSPPYAEQSGSIVGVNTNTLAWQVLTYGSAPGAQIQAEIWWYCTGQTPGGLAVPCCPPDPSVDMRLRSIQDMLMFLMDQTRPAYTTGTVHTGLTGAGTLAIADLVGVKIDITSGVPTNPQLPGTPPYEFSVGWMSVSEPNGMLDEKRITRQHQVWLSGVTPYATVFGYYLNPGFTINVTELIPA